MSLLEDLQKEVREIKEDEVEKNAELEVQQAFYDSSLLPVMTQVCSYFEEIVENLNIIKPDIQAKYPFIPNSERGVSLKQSHYKFRSDNRNHPRQVDINCRCALEKPYEFYLATQKAVEAHVDLLNSYNFPFHRKDQLNSNHEMVGARFFLEGPIHVHIRITASPGDRKVHVALRNMGEQPIKRYKLSPDDVSGEFLERLAKLLLREITQLREVKLGENYRHQLQTQIESENREEEEALAQAYADRESLRLAEESRTYINRSRVAVVEKAQAIRKLLSERRQSKKDQSA
jgi:hypothetical protein